MSDPDKPRRVASDTMPRPKKLAEDDTTVCVTTRRAWRTQLRELEVQTHALPPPHTPASSPGSLSAPSSPLTDASELELDLPSPSRDTSVSASSSSKRQRTPSLLHVLRIATRPRKIKKRASSSAYASGSSSEGEGRQRSVALDESIYRSDRSRSTSAFPPVKVLAREWWSIEDGSPGDGFVSAADVVRGLAKTYKSREFSACCGAWDAIHGACKTLGIPTIQTISHSTSRVFQLLI